MPMFRVKWEIDVEASSHFEAACFAKEIQENPDSTATVFDVRKHDDDKTIEIDIGGNE